MKILDINSNIIQIKPQFYYNSCACNELDSITRRHVLGNIPQFIENNTELLKLKTEFNNIANIIKTSGLTFGKVDYKTVIDNTRSNIKNRYKKAYHNIVNNRICYSDILSRGQSFVKYEKMDYDKYIEGKPPRLIQHRSYEFLYMLKSYILDFDIKMKSTNIEINNQIPNTIFAKSHNNKGVAKILLQHWNSFKFPIALCLDHSKFDGHVNIDLLNIAHDFWNKLYNSKLLKRMLSHTQNNKFITKNGLRYKFKGSRCSGEYTTSTENSLLNYCMLTTWLKSSGITDFKIIVNGDDSVIFIEAQDQIKLRDLSYFHNFNMETELDVIATSFNEISFCQASPCLCNNEWTMIKNPSRLLSRIMYTSEQHKYNIDGLLTAAGLCELACNQGIPILQDFSILLITLGGLKKPLRSIDKIPALRSGNDIEIKEISEQARIQFSSSFGIPIWQQLKIESEIAGLLTINPDCSDFKNFLKRNKHFHHA